MFDINFLNRPGIQGKKRFLEEKEIDNNTEVEKEISFTERNNVIKPKRKYQKALIVFLFCFISLIVIFDNLKTVSLNDNSYFSISYILNIINEDYDKMHLKSIVFDNKKVNIVIEMHSSDKLDEKINFFESFNYNVWGAKVDERHYIYIKEPWQLIDTNIWDLKKIQQYIKNLKGIEYELVDKKIIIVSDFSELSSIFDVFEKKNIINNFIIDVSHIKGNPNNYYKLIIKKYD